ncbi:MAG: hypothetical protein B6243_02540 [Anaerolineaceae bacterium 4572_5.2]|nr:MAG: hypothetical protein B6243_02540 [Anaerolineaceae bacterium 4572_5.2]
MGVGVGAGNVDVGVALETAAVAGDGVGVLLAWDGGVGALFVVVAVGVGCVTGGPLDGVWVKVGRGVFVALAFIAALVGVAVPGSSTITCPIAVIVPVTDGLG